MRFACYHAIHELSSCFLNPANHVNVLQLFEKYIIPDLSSPGSDILRHVMLRAACNLILFVLWIYYSMMILLIGAEVAAVSQGRGRHASASGGDPEEQVRKRGRPTRNEVITRTSKGMGAEVI